jgi:hypothetical protein
MWYVHNLFPDQGAANHYRDTGKGCDAFDMLEVVNGLPVGFPVEPSRIRTLDPEKSCEVYEINIQVLL